MKDSGLQPHHDSASSDHETPPYRSRSILRSPTPTPPPGQPAPGLLKFMIADATVPEWKKKILEKKRLSSGGSSGQEPEELAWKKKLMAKQKEVVGL